MINPGFVLAVSAGKLSAAFCRIFFPKRGSNLPGVLALGIDPLFLTKIKGIETGKTIFITGTNGKSTTNNMISHVFKAAGYSVCTNPEGANMKPGVVTAIINNMDIKGRLKKEYLILEVDERSLEAIVKDLKPGTLCVTNIQKDQVQRNGDPDYIYQKIKRTVCSLEGLTIFVNNEEPRSKSLGALVRGDGRVVSFGVAENDRSTAVEKNLGVTMPCPVCRDALIFSHMNLAGTGFFICPECGFASDEYPDHQMVDIDYEKGTFSSRRAGSESRDEVFHLAYTASFFTYNYALCTAVAYESGIGPDILRKAFDTFTNIAGRMEYFIHAGKNVYYMRIKQENPETLQNALDTMAADRKEKALVAGPDVISDIVPNYSNTFYTFDSNFEPLINSNVKKYICFGSVVCWDMANRLRYAGIPENMIEIIDTDDNVRVLDAIALAETDNIYLITLLKKYQQLKERAG